MVRHRVIGTRRQLRFLAGVMIGSVMVTLLLLTMYDNEYTHLLQKRSSELGRWRDLLLPTSLVNECLKTVHIFADVDRFVIVPELSRIIDMLARDSFIPCSEVGYTCDIRVTIGTDFGMLRGKDAVVFGMKGPQWSRNVGKKRLRRVLKLDPEPGQTWVYYSTEPPFRVVRWTNNTDIAKLKYHVLMTYNPQADIQIPFGYYRPFSESQVDVEQRRARALFNLGEVLQLNRSGLISWVASNCHDVFWPRDALVTRLRELLPLDDYGACGRKECTPKRSIQCNKLFASYKFYLAIPNSECNDYITEKFWDIALNTGAVPVVLGAREQDYERVAPPNSYIHVADFESLQDLADYLKKVDADDKLYASYHEWRRKGEVVIPYPLKETEFCRILPYIRTRKPEEIKFVGNSSWYRGCREIPGQRHMQESLGETNLENWVVWR